MVFWVFDLLPTPCLAPVEIGETNVFLMSHDTQQNSSDTTYMGVPVYIASSQSMEYPIIQFSSDTALEFESDVLVNSWIL